MSESRPPDDTPTSLQPDANWQSLHQDAVTIIDGLRADVSRLQQERDNLGVLLKRGLDIMEEAKAERAKLLEENALLKRSLEMLTKQLDEQERSISYLQSVIRRDGALGAQFD